MADEHRRLIVNIRSCEVPDGSRDGEKVRRLDRASIGQPVTAYRCSPQRPEMRPTPKRTPEIGG